MKKNLLYHRVNPRFVKKVLESGKLKTNKTLDGEDAVCFTRDVLYMSKSRPFVVIFDRDKISKFYKIKPCCVIDKLKTTLPHIYQRFKKFKETGFENEERIYSDIPIHLAEYYGELSVGCFDYRRPSVVYKNFQKEE